jgi:hypothetical protein
MSDGAILRQKVIAHYEQQSEEAAVAEAAAAFRQHRRAVPSLKSCGWHHGIS